jgi:hypothetical protein
MATYPHSVKAPAINPRFMDGHKTHLSALRRVDVPRMICPKCKYELPFEGKECPRCGIIFSKYRPRETSSTPEAKLPDTDAEVVPNRGDVIRDLLLRAEPDTNPIYFGGRLLLFILILIYGWKFILTPIESGTIFGSFWHLVNLPFHEAGHIVFRPFGQFMTSLGGSLGQLLMPLVCLGSFIFFTRDVFAGSFALWWFGENFLDLAPYINDARALRLPLLGGNTGQTSPYGFHDWEFILKEAGLLRYDHVLAQISHKMGIVIMLLAYFWGGYMLFKQFKNMDLNG